MMSPPAVSMHLRLLERELGAALFERRGRRISLNRTGEALYRLAMPMVQEVDRLPDLFAERHRGEMRGSLVIGAGQISAAYLLPKFIKAFRMDYPHVRVEIRLGSGSERLDWLRAYELDVVVGAADVAAPEFAFCPILNSTAVLITPADHPLAEHESVAIEAAAGYPFIGHAPTQYTRRLQDMMLRLRSIALDIVVEVDGWREIASYVAAGVGIAIVPDLCLAEMDQLRKIPFDQAVPQRRYGAITRREGSIAGPARRLLQLMTVEAGLVTGSSG